MIKKSTQIGHTSIPLPAHRLKTDEMDDGDYAQYNRAAIFYKKEFENMNATESELDLGEYDDDSRSTYTYKKLNLTHCSQQETNFIRQLCENFPYQFFVDGDIVGNVNITKHYVRLIPNSKIINVRQYRIPHKHKQILDEIITEFERQGIIEKC